AVAEHHLVAVRQREELRESGPHAADEFLDGLLPVRGAHHCGAGGGECGHLFRAHARRACAEAPVGGLEVVGDHDVCGGVSIHGGDPTAPVRPPHGSSVVPWTNRLKRLPRLRRTPSPRWRGSGSSTTTRTSSCPRTRRTASSRAGTRMPAGSWGNRTRWSWPPTTRPDPPRASCC